MECKQGRPEHTLPLVLSLRQEQKVINVNVDLRHWTTGDTGRPRTRPIRDGGVRGRRGRDGLETVRRPCVARIPQLRVAEIANGLCECGEVWRRLHPTHGECQRKGDQGWVTGRNWKGHSELDNIGNLKPNSVKPIGDVDLRHVHRAEVGIRFDESVEHSLERLPKLHCFLWRQGDRLRIDKGESIIHNQPRALIPLRNDPEWVMRRPGRLQTSLYGTTNQ